MTGLPGSDLHGGKQNRRQSGKECERMPQSTKLSTAFLATVILYLAFMFLPLLIPQMDSLPSWATMAAGELLIMVPSLIYVKKNGKDTRRMIPHRRLTIGTVCCLIVFVPAVSPLVSFFNYVTTIFFGNTAAAAAGTITSMPVWAGVLLMAVLPAYCEEFVFRVLFFRGYRRHGVYAAALVRICRISDDLAVGVVVELSVTLDTACRTGIFNECDLTESGIFLGRFDHELSGGGVSGIKADVGGFSVPCPCCRGFKTACRRKQRKGQGCQDCQYFFHFVFSFFEMIL